MDSREHLGSLTKRLNDATQSLEQQRAETNRNGYAAVNGAAFEPNSLDIATREPNLELKDLESISRDLESFIATMTHDLRSPLRSVVGTSQILLDEFGQDLPEEAADLLQRQVAAGLRMSSIIDDLVEYTKLGQGRAKRVDFDFSAIAQDCAYELMERPWPHPVRINVQPELRVVAIPGFLRMVLLELMENSVKFGTRTGPVFVEVGSLQGPSERIYYVKDSGPGFDQSSCGEIFEPFVKLLPEVQGGNGIGLAMVRKAILRHHGRVWAEAAPGFGATFFFTLGESAA